MVKRFLDLHVHSSKSSGVDSRSDLGIQAKLLGTEIRFCDGNSSGDGLRVTFKRKPELKGKLAKASYLILEPLSKESVAAAVRIKHSILLTTLTPSIAKLMNKNKCIVEVCLSSLFGASGINRIRLIKEIKTNLKFARKYDVTVIAATGAKSIYHLRSPHQVFELLMVLGFTEDEATEAMYTNPFEVLSYGKDRIEDRIIKEGVKIL
jgi:RNase P/RNase MRP subunit p30